MIPNNSLNGSSRIFFEEFLCQFFGGCIQNFSLDLFHFFCSKKFLLKYLKMMWTQWWFPEEISEWILQRISWEILPQILGKKSLNNAQVKFTKVSVKNFPMEWVYVAFSRDFLEGFAKVCQKDISQRIFRGVAFWR